jgi:hypothetical protein
MALFFKPRKSIPTQDIRAGLEAMARVSLDPNVSSQHVVAEYLRTNVALGDLLAEKTEAGAKPVNWGAVILVIIAQGSLFALAYFSEGGTTHPGLSENLYTSFQALFAVSIAAISFEGVKDDIPIKL